MTLKPNAQTIADLDFMHEEVASIQRAINQGDVSPIPGFAPAGFDQGLLCEDFNFNFIKDNKQSRKLAWRRGDKSSLESLATCPASHLQQNLHEAALCWTCRSSDFGHLFWTFSWHPLGLQLIFTGCNFHVGSEFAKIFHLRIPV